MNLRDGLPTAYEADGIIVRIHTGTSVWMRIARRLEKGGESGGYEALAALESAVIAWERDGEEVLPGLLQASTKNKIFQRLFEFLRGGEEPTPNERQGPRVRLIDYDKDMGALYAAFLQVYHVDLYACMDRRENGDEIFLIDVFHWWKFLALLNSLPAGNTMRDYYMHYRGLDLSRLPAGTPEERKHKADVAAIQRRVALDAAPASSAGHPCESRYAQRAREMRDAQ